MHLSGKSVYGGVITLLSLASVGNAMGDCNNGPYAPSLIVGLNPAPVGAIESCWAEYDVGRVVVGVEVWAEHYHVKGLELTLSNNEKRLIGAKVSKNEESTYHSTLEWTVKDRVKSVTMYMNQDKDALGRVIITLSTGRTLDVGNPKEVNAASKTDIDVGGGTLIGAQGKNSGFIINLAWVFLTSPIVDAQIIKLDFAEDVNEWNKEKRGIQEQAHADHYFVNESPLGSNASTFKFSNGVDVLNTRALTQSSTHIVGAEVSVKVSTEVQVPLVAKASIETSIGASYSYESMESETNTFTQVDKQQWDHGGTASDAIQPQFAMHCRAVSFRGKFQSKYTSTVRVTMMDGKTFDMQQTGNYISTSWTESVSGCKSLPISEVPQSALLDSASHTSVRSLRAVEFTA